MKTLMFALTLLAVVVGTVPVYAGSTCYTHCYGNSCTTTCY